MIRPLLVVSLKGNIGSVPRGPVRHYKALKWIVRPRGLLNWLLPSLGVVNDIE